VNVTQITTYTHTGNQFLSECVGARYWGFGKSMVGPIVCNLQFGVRGVSVT